MRRERTTHPNTSHVTAVNGDLIGTLELIEAGLLPAPSVAG